MSKFKFTNAIGLAALLGLTAGTIASVVSAQIPTRMHATKLADIATGTPTAVTCTQSGTGCFLDVSVGGGAFPNGQTVSAGSGTATSTVNGTLTTNVTSTSTGADTTETTLWTYTMPGNTLDVNGKSLRITAWGITAANVNNKTLALYFGGTVLRTNTAAINGGTWFFTALVQRIGATTQIGLTEYRQGAIVINPNNTSPTETLSGPVVIKVTGTNGTASAADIVFKGAMIETVGGPP